MVTYLIKVTLIWALMLLLYELFYRRNRTFLLNRLYLLLSLCIGALLPLIPLELPAGAGSNATNVVNTGLQQFNQVVSPAAPQADEAAAPIDAMVVMGWVYLAGLLLILLINIRGLVLILRTAVYGEYREMEGYRIFHSHRRVHAPFSFMGWIFIARPEAYTRGELCFILRHEDAHNRRRHWLDLLLVQVFGTVFWFHPLVWRYRYLLRLVHEYEADRIAAGNEAYDYGHFLLQQTLLKGTPAIAHSFHFSPIKNRITMLTQQRKTQAWKYTFWIPALCAGLLLAAKPAENNERVRVGDKTSFRGHDFYWSPEMRDSIMIKDPETGAMSVRVLAKEGEIRQMDREEVYSNDDPEIVKVRFNKDGKEIYDYAKDLFRKQFPQIPDSIRAISVKNMVVDEKGKLRYYEVQCLTDNWAAYDNARSPELIANYIRALEKIMDESPDWQPAKVGDKNVKVRLPGGFNVYFKPLMIRPVKRIER